VIDTRPRPAILGVMENQSLSNPGLPAHGLVANLADDDRAMLSSYGNFRYLEAGDTIIHQREAQNSLYFVISGHLHAKRNDTGREILVGTIKAGEWFGEVNIFDPGEASATVTAIDPSQLWLITRDELQAYINGYPESSNRLLISIATLLAGRLRSVSSKLVDKVEYAALVGELGGQ